MFPLQTTAPIRSPPLVTWALIAGNCGIFLFQLSLAPEEMELFLLQFALVPALYFAPPPLGDLGGDPLSYLPFFTNMFLHGGWLHLLLNMFSLLAFSGFMELYLGPLRFILLYFGSMVGGDLLALWIHRNNGSYNSVGASGAVCGLIFAAIALVPGMSIGFFFALPGWLYGLLFVLYSIYGIRSGKRLIILYQHEKGLSR